MPRSNTTRVRMHHYRANTMQECFEYEIVTPRICVERSHGRWSLTIRHVDGTTQTVFLSLSLRTIQERAAQLAATLARELPDVRGTVAIAREIVPIPAGIPRIPLHQPFCATLDCPGCAPPAEPDCPACAATEEAP